MSTAATDPGLMAAADPLAQLKPLHLPDAVGLWPPAPGWWLLALLVLSLLLYSVLRLRRYRRDNRYRRQALHELERFYRDWQRHGDRQRFLRQSSELLRRAALVAFPRDKVAGLHGDAWLEFLAASSNISEFRNAAGAILGIGPWQPDPEFDPDELKALVGRWLRQHRRKHGQRHLAEILNQAPQAASAADTAQPEPRAQEAASGFDLSRYQRPSQDDGSAADTVDYSVAGSVAGSVGKADGEVYRAQR